MKRLLIVIFVAIMLLVVAATIYVLLTQPASAPTGQTKTPETNDAEQGTAQGEKGKYANYTENVIESTAGTKVLFFHAPWCPQCRAIEADITRRGVPEGVTIIKVDYDSHQDLRKNYGITIQTSFVLVDDQGQLVKKYVAYDEPNLAAVERNLLDR